MHPLKEMKLQLKDVAKRIKLAKKSTKQVNRDLCKEFQIDGRLPSYYWHNDMMPMARFKELCKQYDILEEEQKELRLCRNIFRMYHIAYCEVQGKTREQIEPRCRVRDNWTGTEYQGHYNCMNQEIEKIKAELQENILMWENRRFFEKQALDHCQIGL